MQDHQPMLGAKKGAGRPVLILLMVHGILLQVAFLPGEEAERSHMWSLLQKRLMDGEARREAGTAGWRGEGKRGADGVCGARRAGTGGWRAPRVIAASALHADRALQDPLEALG